MSKIYEIRDRIGNTTLNLVIAESAGQAVRDNMPNFWRFLPKEDVEMYEIGTWNRSTGVGFMKEQRLKIDIETAYRFPEVVAKNESKSVAEDIQTMQKIETEIENNTNKEAAYKAREITTTEA